MDTKIIVRKIDINDLSELQRVGRQAFYETFWEESSEENMRRYLDESFAAEKLSRELHNEKSLFYFAEIKSIPVGYLKLNFYGAQTEEQDQNSIEIERIYVLKEYLGKNVGKLLFETALDVARRHRSSYIWLGVSDENPRAVRFYEKNGFVVFGKHTFKFGAEDQTDLLMKLDLD